ncbi:putative diguanylate cyclase YcdT [Mixta intestinalis]|uniref:diguanylate cyclase n=1 Tax=Mixta intestinalis TaxID=1615494 RepID=A0A6P1Q5D1_9GAMM|nr:putative diguanylate cyclase YcdT [Mixta intestinalis]
MLPINKGENLSFSLPATLIVALSLLLLAFILIQPDTKRPLLSLTAFIMGSLWAWLIVHKSALVFYFDGGFLLISLMTVFFISAISLSEHLLAFCLHIAPPSLAVLTLDRGQHSLTLLFTITLPLIGFTLQSLMQRRSDHFTRRLLFQLYEEKQTWSDLSMLDPLTGLYNRRGLKNRLESLLNSHAGSHFVMLLDIDNFKAYNDNYGHAMGDQALARVSVAIRDAVRSRDVVTRYGGEEFLVLITNVNAAIAMRLAERIRQHVLDLGIPHHFNHLVSTHVTISAGIAPIIEQDAEQAIANADRALYVAKNRGRNTILSWDEICEAPPISQPADLI